MVNSIKYEILNKINLPSDIKNLSFSELDKLASEIRKFLILNVSETGGHLASNLGIVELTLALHTTFNSPVDKIIWDVGHQSYVHKILTGRKDKFNKLRRLDGISGFPKSSESEYDIFNTGHASTSISAALGIAISRQLKQEKNHVISVIGDGALTGGMAYEALNHAGNLKIRVIIILNDNGMSISENIGGLSRYLDKIRSNPEYFKAKKITQDYLNRIPRIGSKLSKAVFRIKDGVKHLLQSSFIFEDLGIKYIGPVDGHNIPDLIEKLNQAKQFDTPVLVHVHTKKGKGYSLAEQMPSKFHRAPKFNVESGDFIDSLHTQNKADGKKILKSGSVVCAELLKTAPTRQDIVVISAAMPDGTGMKNFFEKYPDRSFDVGIAEQHAVTLAAGMASNGLKPIVVIYSSFLQRAYDQILHDVSIQKLNTVFFLDRSGVVDGDGETHHGIYDIAYLSHIPNMTILAPSSAKMLSKMTDYAINRHNIGPIAIRYPAKLPLKIDTKIDNNLNSNLKNNLNNIIVDNNFIKCNILKSGKDITIISVGNMLSNVLEGVELSNIDAEIVDLICIKPLDREGIIKSVSKTKRVLIVEDGCKIGGVGSMIESLILQEIHEYVNITKFGYDDEIVQLGTTDQLHKIHGLDPSTISDFLLDSFKRGIAKQIYI